MTANGWRKRQISTLHAEIDEFEEVMAERIMIEEEIAMLEALIVYVAKTGEGGSREQLGVDLDESLKVARGKLQELK